MNSTKPFASFRWSIIFLVASLVAASAPQYAAVISAYPENVYQAGDREVALLPRYCMYTQLFRARIPGGNNQGEIGGWISLMGETFHHMHHYCAGLVRTNRALILAYGSRKYNLEESIREFDYVIDRAPADFVLLPEILTKKGENLLLLDNTADGAAALIRAIELKSDYWPPYAVLSDYFKKHKNIAFAREWLEKGLAASPDARALRQRMTELGSVKAQ
jgi:tetratricopeptide (TPR) repeat protein